MGSKQVVYWTSETWWEWLQALYNINLCWTARSPPCLWPMVRVSLEPVFLVLFCSDNLLLFSPLKYLILITAYILLIPSFNIIRTIPSATKKGRFFNGGWVFFLQNPLQFTNHGLQLDQITWISTGSDYMDFHWIRLHGFPLDQITWISTGSDYLDFHWIRLYGFPLGQITRISTWSDNIVLDQCTKISIGSVTKDSHKIKLK